MKELLGFLPSWVKWATGGLIAVILLIIIGIAVLEIRDAIRERRY